MADGRGVVFHPIRTSADVSGRVMSDVFTFSRRSALGGMGVALAAGVAGYVVARNSSAARDKGPSTAANGYGAPHTEGRRLASLQQIPAGGGLILTNAEIVLT